jgi:hypothetical protein
MVFSSRCFLQKMRTNLRSRSRPHSPHVPIYSPSLSLRTTSLVHFPHYSDTLFFGSHLCLATQMSLVVSLFWSPRLLHLTPPPPCTRYLNFLAFNVFHWLTLSLCLSRFPALSISPIQTIFLNRYSQVAFTSGGTNDSNNVHEKAETAFSLSLKTVSGHRRGGRRSSRRATVGSIPDPGNEHNEQHKSGDSSRKGTGESASGGCGSRSSCVTGTDIAVVVRSPVWGASFRRAQFMYSLKHTIELLFRTLAAQTLNHTPQMYSCKN